MTTMQVQPHIPEGFMQDSKGRLVPVELIDEIDTTRNDLVLEILNKAEQLQEQLHDFKAATLDDIGAFIDLAGEKYQIAIGGKKGNVTLTSYDGLYKIQRAIQEHIAFDERLQAAKELIDRCIHRWSEGTRSELRVLVDDAFQVDKEGLINTGRVLSLRRHSIEDEEWQRAMQAIADSIQVSGSKTYIRIYKRSGPDHKWQPVSLDLATV
ncbi:MAG: DUF3164 family protein [Neptuniibacter sp.]